MDRNTETEVQQHAATTVPTFETSRLILKQVSLSDASAWQRHFADYEVISQLAGRVPWPYPENGVADFLNNVILPAQCVSRWTWGIFLNENPEELIGVVDLWRQGCPENRGFWLGRKFWGRGIMTEAVGPVTQYAFETLGFDKLIFNNAKGNVRSRRVKEKSGARLIDVVPAKFVNPEYTEQEIWELTKEMWRQAANKLD